MGVEAYMVDNAADLKPEWIAGKPRVGVTAGASAPEVLVQQVIARLQAWGGGQVVEIQGRPENVVFSLPRALRPSPSPSPSPQPSPASGRGSGSAS
jgi:4-hydroxy-3-methylbut-2-enyl diphosphate reductase